MATFVTFYFNGLAYILRSCFCHSAEYLERIREEMKESAMYDQILAETYLKYLIEDSKKNEETYNKILKIFNSLVRND